jgi:hypothetical protein
MLSLITFTVLAVPSFASAACTLPPLNGKGFDAQFHTDIECRGPALDHEEGTVSVKGDCPCYNIYMRTIESVPSSLRRLQWSLWSCSRMQGARPKRSPPIWVRVNIVCEIVGAALTKVLIRQLLPTQATGLQTTWPSISSRLPLSVFAR